MFSEIAQSPNIGYSFLWLLNYLLFLVDFLLDSVEAQKNSTLYISSLKLYSLYYIMWEVAGFPWLSETMARMLNRYPSTMHIALCSDAKCFNVFNIRAYEFSSTFSSCGSSLAFAESLFVRHSDNYFSYCLHMKMAIE